MASGQRDCQRIGFDHQFVQSGAEQAGGLPQSGRARTELGGGGGVERLKRRVEFRGHHRQDHAARHFERQLTFDADATVIFLDENFIARFHFLAGEDAVLREQRQIFRRDIGLERGDGILRVGQPAPRGFFAPFFGIAVAVENYPLMGFDDVLQQGLEFGVEIGFTEVFELGGEVVDGVGHDGVENHHRPGAALARTRGAKLELVAGEGEGAGAVAVGRVARQRRQGIDADAHGADLAPGGGGALFELFNHVGELVAEVNRDDRRRRFIGAEPVVVAGAGYGGAQNVAVQVDRLNDCAEHGQEDRVLFRVVAGVEQIGVAVAQRPVVVLARAVDAGEGFFVKQTDQTVTVGDLPQHFHDQHVVVDREIHVFKHRRQFELGRRHFIVPGLGRDAERPQFFFNFVHEGEHPVFDRPEVMIFKLLVFRRRRAEERPSGLDQIGALQVEALVDQEVFLLCAERDGDPFLGQLEALHQPLDRHAQRLGGAQQRRFLVQRLAGVAAEGGRDAERRAVRMTLDEGRAGRVPRGVTARLEGAAQSARRET
ncbi:hypothetical protein SDC9_96255 [bioreactor metagenome]|uniref:Uncharacterized protein n=1 Tax=bioreactor metagenome TaxID=1076179 RepID=A0A645A8K8_9ZZZZ